MSYSQYLCKLGAELIISPVHLLILSEGTHLLQNVVPSCPVKHRMTETVQPRAERDPAVNLLSDWSDHTIDVVFS